MPALRDRLRSLLQPPLPLVPNPRENNINAPLGRYNLYLGGANRRVPGYINLDIARVAGVDVQADAHHLPFRSDLFSRVECDAVLEHVVSPIGVVDEIRRVLAPGGFAHLVVPFCHPFHEYPRDFHRFSIDGLALLAGDLEVIDRGWRTGPTATLLVFLLEYVKLWLPWRWWRIAVHGALGWGFAPFRYLDLLLLKTPNAGRIGNHCYIWLRKRS